MTRSRDRIEPPRGMAGEILAVLSLAAVGVLAHGLLVIKLGFYWDDWPLVWIHHSIGPEGYGDYFQGNRPVLGQIYRLLFPILGLSPLKWGLVAAVLRILGGLAVYSLFRGVWRNTPFLAWTIAAFALVYPGFSQQSIAVTYAPTHLAFLLFAVSLSASVWAQSQHRWRWPLTALSVATGAVSYLIVEYFIGLEFLRPLIFFMMDRERDRIPMRAGLKAAVRKWAPYTPALLIFVTWRIFFFRSPAQDNPHMYDGLGQLEAIVSSPLTEIGERLLVFVTNILNATVVAWTRAMGPDLLDHTFGKSVPISWFVGILIAICGVVAAWVLRPAAPRAGCEDHERPESRAAGPCLALGALALVLGGAPNIYANLPIDFTMDSYGDRYSLPYLLGACLVLAGVVASFRMSRRGKLLLVSALLFLMGSVQFRFANHFRQDWSEQKSLVCQLAWRAPALEPGTAVFVNDLPRSLGFNHAAGLLNLMYNETGSGGRLDYFIFSVDWLADPASILRTGAPWIFLPGEPVIGRLRSFEFKGSTDRCVVVCRSPGGSLRFLDRNDGSGRGGADLPCGRLAGISDPSGVISMASASPSGPLLDIMGLEAESTWGYFFQKADLAGQFADWEQVVDLGERAKELELGPDDPMEWIPFIEGNLRLGRAESAARQSLAVLKDDPFALSALTAVWDEALVTRPDLEDAVPGPLRKPSTP